jgi:3-oxoacyl-[acyl-carrier protein] reductase
MRNVLVTGASRGLGLAMTRRLVADGYRVLAVARTPTPDLTALCESSAGAAVFEPYDLCEINTLADFARGLRRAHGPVWGLVNNAGASREGVLANQSLADIEGLIRLNTLAPMVLTRSVIRPMMAAGAGRVVNISSIVAFQGAAGLSVYAATKSALLGFTRSLAREVGGLGVTVNAVAPGFAETELTQSASAGDLARIARRSALGRLTDPESVAAAVAYLLSEDARSVTGTVLTVDAGALA